MNTKILIIGQAPPAVKQTLPYDTTMLYDMFSWVGITKEKAQELFEFEAMVDFFTGHSESGHLKPTMDQMKEYYERALKEKISKSDKVIVLGRVAQKALIDLHALKGKQVVYLVHPSRRNYNIITHQKETIIKSLKSILT